MVILILVTIQTIQMLQGGREGGGERERERDFVTVSYICQCNDMPSQVL